MQPYFDCLATQYWVRAGGSQGRKKMYFMIRDEKLVNHGDVSENNHNPFARNPL